MKSPLKIDVEKVETGPKSSKLILALAIWLETRGK